MPRIVRGVPKYRCHKASGQAVVTLQGRDVYLGPWKSKASKVEYDRLIGEWLAAGRPHSFVAGAGHGLVISQLLIAYWRHAEAHYRKDGEPTGELDSIRVALRYLKTPYGHTTAAEFGPVALAAVRQRMVAAGGSRNYVNKLVARIRRVFKWGASQELVPVTTWQALGTLDGLRRGKTAATERPPVGPVEDAAFEATLAHMPRVAADLLRVQRLTGARPGEICILRPIDVDRSRPIWTYTPSRHKTEHRGRERRIFIGPKAQAVLQAYLAGTEAAEFCFRPANRTGHRAERYDSRTLHHAVRRANALRAGLVRPKRPTGEVSEADQAAHREAVKAFNVALAAVSWSPNQLRHSAATEIRRRFGLEAAQVVLGHAELGVTQVYAERDAALAERVANEVG